MSTLSARERKVQDVARERKIRRVVVEAESHANEVYPLRWLAEKYVDEQTKMTRATNKAVRDALKGRAKS